MSVEFSKQNKKLIFGGLKNPRNIGTKDHVSLQKGFERTEFSILIIRHFS